MKLFFTGLFFMVISINFAQIECDDTSFIVPVEGDIVRTELVYGSNLDYFDNPVNLSMDVYELDGEAGQQRPLVILAHGGGFVFGSKADMQELCEGYASLGYVCASVQYRLYPFILAPFIDSTTVVEMAFNAISDMRGAVRYFKADADQENQFNIDTDRIIVGGISAGAIMALHTGFFHEGDIIPEGFEALIESKGGIEGNTGDSLNLSYNSRVQGIISLSGATFDTLWVTEDDPPIMSMHGDADDVLPYGFDREGAFNQVTLYGSSKIHERAENIGLTNFFEGVPGGGHTNIYSSPQFAENLVRFNLNVLNIMQDIVCDEVATSSDENKMPTVEVNMFPNPTSGQFTILTQDEGHWEFIIFDGAGRIILQEQNFGKGAFTIDNWQAQSGWYVVHARLNGQLQSANMLLIK